MAVKSDIEIAQEATMLHIRDVAEKVGITEDDLEYYGRYKAKLTEEYLKKAKDVTVITNGIHSAMELQRNSNFKSIIILGGMLRPHSGAIEGLSSKEMIGRLSAEFYFVSGNGFSADAGLSGDNFFELELKRLCADRAKKIVALIDSTKLGADSASSFIPADRIDYLVTDSGASPESVALCRAKGIEVLIADV